MSKSRGYNSHMLEGMVQGLEEDVSTADARPVSMTRALTEALRKSRPGSNGETPLTEDAPEGEDILEKSDEEKLFRDIEKTGEFLGYGHGQWKGKKGKGFDKVYNYKGDTWSLTAKGATNLGKTGSKKLNIMTPQELGECSIEERTKSAADAAAHSRDHDDAYMAGRQPATTKKGADTYGADKGPEVAKKGVGKGPADATDASPDAADNSKGVQKGKDPEGAKEVPTILCDKEGDEGDDTSEDTRARAALIEAIPPGWEQVIKEEDETVYEKMLPKDTLLSVSLWEDGMAMASYSFAHSDPSSGSRKIPTIYSDNVEGEPALKRFMKEAERWALKKIGPLGESTETPEDEKAPGMKDESETSESSEGGDTPLA